MKRLLTVVIVLLVMGIIGNVYAQTASTQGRFGDKEAFTDAFSKAREMVAEGKVLSHDVACHCIVLETPNGNLVVQDDYASFNQDYNRAKGLKIGERAKITYKTIDYINYATRVEQ